MSKRNKVVYSNIQPNTKEAGIWVNTDGGNIKIEKDGKWIDDGGGSSEGDIQPIIKYYKPLNNTAVVGGLLPYVITCIINKTKWNRIQLAHSYEGDYTDVVAFNVVTNAPIPSELTAGLKNGLATFDELQLLFGGELMSLIQEITEEEYNDLLK